MSSQVPSPDRNLLDVVALKKYFPIRGGLAKRQVGAVRAVDDVTFSIKRGETVGLVGESGCGKTTVGRAIMMLTPPSSGYVFLEAPRSVVKDFRDLVMLTKQAKGKNLTPQNAARILKAIDNLLATPACEVREDKKKNICADAAKLSRQIGPGDLSASKAREVLETADEAIEEAAKRYCINYRKKSGVKRLRSRIQFVFQDPFSSLDPKMLIKDIVAEPLRAQRKYIRKAFKGPFLPEDIKKAQTWYSGLTLAEKKKVVATKYDTVTVDSAQIEKTAPPKDVPKVVMQEYLRYEAISRDDAEKVQTWYSNLPLPEKKKIVATRFGKIKATQAEIDKTIPPTEVPKAVMLEYLWRQAKDIRKRVVMQLEKVGLNVEHMYRFPHEFSGGQRQRIGIARALSVKPDFVVLDEPTSALDVSVQAQILNMLNALQNDFGLTYLFISHDLSTIKYMCDRVAVMYLGKIAEYAVKNELFAKPVHPYTEALLSVIPVPDPDLRRDRIILPGDVPSPANPPPGCRFHTRCPIAVDICKKVEPPLIDIGNEHYVACHVRAPAPQAF